MKIFLDSVDIKEIKELIQTGLIDGVTTNPSMIAKSKLPIKEVITEIAQVVIDRPVSAEVTALSYKEMLKQAESLRKLGDNVAIKVPLNFDGLKVCKNLADEGTMVNVTLCFSPQQALLAAKAGATFISPFVGRLDDLGLDGICLIQDIAIIYDNYTLDTQILSASVRGPKHFVEVAKAGSDIATITGTLFKQLYKHPLTDNGLDIFLKDWAKAGQVL